MTAEDSRVDFKFFCSAELVKPRLFSALADLGGGREGRTPPPGRPNSFDFMQFSGKFGVFTPPWRVHAPPRENPGSATVLGTLRDRYHRR